MLGFYTYLSRLRWVGISFRSYWSVLASSTIELLMAFDKRSVILARYFRLAAITLIRGPLRAFVTKFSGQYFSRWWKAYLKTRCTYEKMQLLCFWTRVFDNLNFWLNWQKEYTRNIRQEMQINKISTESSTWEIDECTKMNSPVF